MWEAHPYWSLFTQMVQTLYFDVFYLTCEKGMMGCILEILDKRI